MKGDYFKGVQGMYHVAKWEEENKHLSPHLGSCCSRGPTAVSNPLLVWEYCGEYCGSAAFRPPSRHSSGSSVSRAEATHLVLAGLQPAAAFLQLPLVHLELGLQLWGERGSNAVHQRRQ